MGNGSILIIASYGGSDRHKSQHTPSDFLRIQHSQLGKLKSKLNKVLVVVNEANGGKEYEESLRLFPSILRRPNVQGSYGAWKEGFLKNPGYNWYFFVEDDYTFFLDDFDQRWIDLWDSRFNSYIATKAGCDWGLPRHASISNGLSSEEVLKNVDWSGMIAQHEYDANLQLQWSSLFGNGLTDIRGRYAAPYWNMRGYMEEHGDPRFPVLIGPVQLLLGGGKVS